MVRKYKPVFTDSSIHGGFQIFMIPYIINTNLHIPLKIANVIEINDIIVGINAPNRNVNYESKKIKQYKYAIKMNEKLPLDKQLPVPKLNIMFHSFCVIVQIPQTNAKINISVFESGTLKVTSSSHDEHVSVNAVHLFAAELLRVAKKYNLYSDIEKNDKLYFNNTINVIDTFIRSKKTNQPIWQYDLNDEGSCNEIKREIKEYIRKYNTPNVHYDGDRESLQGMLGAGTNCKKYNEGIVFGIFPAVIRAQSQLKFKINCKEIYNKLKDKYNLVYHPYSRSKVSFNFPIAQKYSQKVDINPTGMITFLTKTREEMAELFPKIMKIFEENDFSLENKVGTTLFDSSDSD